MKIFIILSLVFFLSYSKDFSKKKEVKVFINELVKKEAFSKKDLLKLFSKVKIQKDSLSFYTTPFKGDYKSYNWDRYSKNFLSKKKISNGVLFYKRNKKSLEKAYKIYGVNPEFIVSIIGIESNYGSFTGKHNVFDTLTTLAFMKNRRNKFFKKELKAYLIMTKKQKHNPKSINGSFAGAIGLGQFMPSNFEKIAIDFDKNSQVDLNTEIDAIGSVANYLKISGWKKDEVVTTRVSYKGKRFNKYKTGYKTLYKRIELKGIKPKKRFYYNKKVTLIKLKKRTYDELWYGAKNFRVITTYNRSGYYAMSVYKLAKEIKKRVKIL